MKKSIFLVLIFTFYSQSYANELILKDKFVFKVGLEAYSVQDLKTYQRGILDLRCIYPGAILFHLFPTINQRNLDLLMADSKLSSKRRAKILRPFINYARLKSHVKGNKIFLSKKLLKGLYLHSKKNNCDLSSFDRKGNLTGVLYSIVQMEGFLRQRFLPEEKSGNASKLDFKKSVKSAQRFLGSIKKQLIGEIFQ